MSASGEGSSRRFDAFIRSWSGVPLSAKKKATALLKPVEKLTRSLVEAGDTTTGTYLRRHKRAYRKRRDGWVRDLPSNIIRATTKGAREIRPASILGL
jgi:Family of unknown function (DUF6312)